MHIRVSNQSKINYHNWLNTLFEPLVNIKYYSLNAGPSCLASWHREKVTVQRSKVKGHRYKIPSVAHRPSLGNMSAHNHRLGPYNYRILACTQKASLPPGQTDIQMDRKMGGCLGLRKYPSDKKERKWKCYFICPLSINKLVCIVVFIWSLKSNFYFFKYQSIKKHLNVLIILLLIHFGKNFGY